MVKVSNNSTANSSISSNSNSQKNKASNPPAAMVSNDKLSITPSGPLNITKNDRDTNTIHQDIATRKLAKPTKKKLASSKQNRLRSTAATKVQKPNQSNVIISSSSLTQKSQLSIQPSMIATTLIQQPTSTPPVSLPAQMPAQILSSLLLRGCNKAPVGLGPGKIQTPISITLPTEPLPRSAASQHNISSDLKLRQCPAIVAVAPATPRTVLMSPSGIPTVTMVQANTPPVSPMTVVTVPNRAPLPQKITLPQVPVPQSELVVQRAQTLHVSLQNGARGVVPSSLPTPPPSTVSCESTMSGGSEDSSPSSVNNSIILSSIDGLNNLSSNTLIDFDVMNSMKIEFDEDSIDCMADINQPDSSLNGDIMSVKEEIILEDNNLLEEDSIMDKIEPILNIKEDSTGALLDQSEDPCLNEGQNGNSFHHHVQNLTASGIQLNNNNNNNNIIGGSMMLGSTASTLNSSSSLNSTYLKCLSHIEMGNNGAITNSPFASDNMELDNVHRWLELCDAASSTV